MTTNGWVDWVRKEIRAAGKRSETGLLEGIADVLAEERAKLRRENEMLRQALADVTARLDKLEQIERSSVPPFLRAV